MNNTGIKLTIFGSIIVSLLGVLLFAVGGLDKVLHFVSSLYLMAFGVYNTVKWHSELRKRKNNTRK